MAYKIVSKPELVKEFSNYNESKKIYSHLEPNHLRIREFFENNYNELKQTLSDYELDCELAYRFFDFINNENDQSLKLLINNYDFWKYIAVFDIPHIIDDRFGTNNINHFYGKGVACYPFTLYWYIYLCWQGNKEDTKKITNGKSTDIIMQLVERPSKLGINLELYREIMREFGKITNGGNNGQLFRLILKRNTEKLVVFRPEIFPGGVNGYVKMIFGEYYE